MIFDVPPERQYLTAAEAAAEKLPGFEYQERQIQYFIRDGELKPARKRAGKGGGREFHWSALPRQARDEYLKRYGVQQQAEGEDIDPAAKSAKRDLRAEARKLIVDAAKVFVEERRTTIGKGLKTFSKLYAKRRTKLPSWVYGVEPSADPEQVRRWDGIIRRHGSGALIDRRGRPSETRVLDRDDAMRIYIVSQIAARPHLTATQLCQMISVDLQREISLRTLQRFIAKWRDTNAPTLKALTNPDQHRSHHKPAFGRRDENVTFINARWELDATRADAMCLLPDGTRKRYALTQLIDVFTRRAMILVSDQPRAAATMALFRRAIIAWGIPAEIKSDNGKEFIARAVVRFCDDMGIKIVYSHPFTPEEKPFVERFFGTLNRGLFPLLPGYVGANIVQRKAIESRASFSHRFGEEAQLVLETNLSPEGLQGRVDAWLRDVYELQIHSGLNATPREIALAHADDAKFIGDERLLDALLMDAPDAGGIRIVGKRGIRISNRCYIAPELGARMGDHVHVRMDPHDIGRIVVYNAERSVFVCVAEDPDLTGADRQKIAVQAQSVQRKHLRLVRETMRSVQRQFPAAGIADRLLTHAGGDAFMPDEETRKAMFHAGPRLIAQRDALDALDQAKAEPQPVEPTAEEQAAHVAFMDELQPAPAPVTYEQCDGYRRPSFIDDDFGFFDWATSRLASGETLDARDTANFERLQNDQAFADLRRLKKLEEERRATSA